MKILGFTSIRSDYDLLYPLYELLNKDKEIDFKLIVSGAHLSKRFGYTKQYIEKDGFPILLEIENLIDSDTYKSRIKTASILLQNIVDVVDSFRPDAIVYAGDREDVIMYALVGMYLNIPTIHFYGGDHEKDGHNDTYIRHATSKLSSLHFVALEEHKKRLISLGENPDRIFVIGSPSLDRIKKFNLKSNHDLIQLLGINEKFLEKFALVIYHPISGECADKTFKNILIALKNKGFKAFVSYPNTDPNNKKIINVINQYKSDSNFFFFTNLDRDIFLSLFKKSCFLIGNSSAGIYEAATLKKAVINVGKRQKNRKHSGNVVFCNTSLEDIEKAIERVTSKNFREKMINIQNIYEVENSAKIAYQLIKSIDFSKYIPKIEDPLELYMKDKK